MSEETFYSIYNSIMGIDSKVRFVSVVDSSGSLIFGGQREGIDNYLSPENQQKSLKHAVDAWQLRSQFGPSIGDCKYVMAEYGKIKRFTFPINKKYLLYFTADQDIDHNDLTQKVLELIKTVQE